MVSDVEVLTKASTPSVHALLQKASVKWAGHVTHMPDDHLPERPLYGELCEGKLSVGGQKKCFEGALRVPESIPEKPQH